LVTTAFADPGLQQSNNRARRNLFERREHTLRPLFTCLAELRAAICCADRKSAGWPLRPIPQSFSVSKLPTLGTNMTENGFGRKMSIRVATGAAPEVSTAWSAANSSDFSPFISMLPLGNFRSCSRQPVGADPLHRPPVPSVDPCAGFGGVRRFAGDGL
jgi:hypothetical protein